MAVHCFNLGCILSLTKRFVPSRFSSLFRVQGNLSDVGVGFPNSSQVLVEYYSSYGHSIFINFFLQVVDQKSFPEGRKRLTVSNPSFLLMIRKWKISATFWCRKRWHLGIEGFDAKQPLENAECKWLASSKVLKVAPLVTRFFCRPNISYKQMWWKSGKWWKLPL